jgi:hypothetical protein
VTTTEAAGVALGLAGLVVCVWMPALGSVLVVGGVVLLVVGRFRGRTSGRIRAKTYGLST